MTILNAICSSDRVLLSADTACGVPGGKKSRTTKIFPLMHFPAIIAGTGSTELAPALQMTLVNETDFDTVLTNLPSRISQLYSKIKSELFSVVKIHILERQGIFIAGWSVSRNRFLARWVHQDNESSGFQIASFDDSFLLTPWEGEPPPLPVMRGDLVELARRQYKIWQAKRPDAAFGGELIVAELTKNAISIELVWDLNRDCPQCKLAPSIRSD